MAPNNLLKLVVSALALYLIFRYRSKKPRVVPRISKPAKRVCIVGAGPSGLTACKEALAAGLEPTVFEMTDQVGGNWVFREETSHSSVYNCTRIDNSKHILAFSDFPPPKDFPYYCSHKLILQYLNLYVDHFGFRKHINFNTKVERCTVEGNGWKVITSKNGVKTEHHFDGLLICNGHHNIPRIPPEFTSAPFKGEILHSHSYKYPEHFKNKRVVVIGIGNSGVDIACDTSHSAGKVYLSTRTGAYILPKMVKSRPLDYQVSYLGSIVPWAIKRRLAPWVYRSIVGDLNDVSPYLQPKGFTFIEAHPTVSGELISRVSHGYIDIKPNVRAITEHHVEFEDGSKVEVDAIILATGYDFEIPFIDKGLLQVEGYYNRMYQYMWPTEIENHPPLAVIGLVQPIGSLFPAVELQSRYAAGVFSGRLKLPSGADMKAAVAENERIQRSHYVNRPRHGLECEGFNFQEALAELIGCKPHVLGHGRLAKELLFGPLTGYRFRLEGPDSWSGAAEAIREANRFG